MAKLIDNTLSDVLCYLPNSLRIVDVLPPATVASWDALARIEPLGLHVT